MKNYGKIKNITPLLHHSSIPKPDDFFDHRLLVNCKLAKEKGLRKRQLETKHPILHRGTNHLIGTTR
jgi:hypothetical protein